MQTVRAIYNDMAWLRNGQEPTRKTPEQFAQEDKEETYRNTAGRFLESVCSISLYDNKEGINAQKTNSTVRVIYREMVILNGGIEPLDVFLSIPVYQNCKENVKKAVGVICDRSNVGTTDIGYEEMKEFIGARNMNKNNTVRDISVVFQEMRSNPRDDSGIDYTLEEFVNYCNDNAVALDMWLSSN